MIEIIPAIDIIDGKCVRLTKGDFNQTKIYNENPVEVAKQFEEKGIKRLHLVDLDGAKTGTIKNQKVLESMAIKTKLKIDFGGGVKTEHDVEDVIKAGAAYVTIGSVAINQPEVLNEWINKFGATKFLIGADTLDNEVKINGWQTSTNKNIFEFIASLTTNGITQIFCTDISKDGMQQGPSIELYKNILQKNKKIKLIASGGITTLQDIDSLVEIGCSGAIIGKALYEGSIKLTDLKKYC